MAEEVVGRENIPRSERPKRTRSHDPTVSSIGRFDAPMKIFHPWDKVGGVRKWEEHSASSDGAEIRFGSSVVRARNRLPQSQFTSAVLDASPVLTPSVVGELSETASTLGLSYSMDVVKRFVACATGLRAWLEPSAWASTRPVLNALPGAVAASLLFDGTVQSRECESIYPHFEAADEIAFLQQVIRLHQTGETDRALDQIFGWTDQQFRAGAWQRCDAMLTRIQPEALDEDIIVGVLTATWPGRTHLANRPAFVELARAKLIAEIGANEAEALISELA